MSDRERCPYCDRALVSPSGSVRAPYLIVGEAPKRDDVLNGSAWSGDVGQIMRSEMVRVGLSPQQFRFMYFWKHSDPKMSEANYLGCYTVCEEALLDAMQQRVGILLCGAKMAVWSINNLVTKYSGLEVTSLLRPKVKDVVTGFVMLSFDPAIALRQPGGEIRLALQRFKERVEENE